MAIACSRRLSWLAFVLLATSPALMAGRFLTSTLYLTDQTPEYIATGDFNGDGLLDIVVAASGYHDHGNTISVFLNTGNGLFAKGVQYPTGNAPQTVAVADFNGDGKLDIAVGNISGYIGILYGNGDGTFQPQVQFEINNSCVATADFNHDGKADLVAYCYKSLHVILGSGTGNFKVSYQSSFNASSVAVGDFNGDGIPDIIAEGQSQVALFLGRGNGTFQQFTYSGGGGRSIAAADFNKDGKMDFVDWNGVYLSNGDGTFQAPIRFNGGPIDASYFVAGDFDGDGIPDLLVSHYDYGDVTLLTGNGDGTLQALSFNFQLGKSDYFIAVADLNNDGLPDLMVADITLNGIQVALGNKYDTFLCARDYPGSSEDGTTGADLNGDGKDELISYSGNTTTPLEVLVNNGDGTFAPPLEYPGNSGWPVFGDINHDGKMDVVTIGNSYLGNGDGTLLPFSTFPTGPAPEFMLGGDFNHDGNLDLAISASNIDSLTVLLGNGDGTFTQTASLTGGYSVRNIAVADFNGDGCGDIADSIDHLIWYSNCDGTFYSKPYAFLTGYLLTGDFNRDGNMDLAMTGYDFIEIYVGDGHGNFKATTSVQGFFFPSAVADMNGDGYPDIVTRYGDIEVQVGVLFNDGKGGFLPPVLVIAGPSFDTGSVGDFNGDGAPDLVVSTDRIFGGNSEVVVLNAGGIVIQLFSNPNPSQFGQPVTFKVNVFGAVPGQNTPTVTVQFTDNGKIVGKANLKNGTVSITTSKLSVGTHNIQATYQGSQQFNVKASRVLQQVVNQ